MGIWGMPKALLLLALLCPPALAIRCYTDLEATQVLELDNLEIFPLDSREVMRIILISFDIIP